MQAPSDPNAIRITDALDDVDRQLQEAVQGRFDVTLHAPFIDERLERHVALLNVLMGSAKNTLAEMEAGAWDLADAMQRLDRSQQQLRAILDAAPSAILTLDGEAGTIHTWNRAGEGIFGYGAAEILGQDVCTLFATRGDAAPLIAAASALADGQILGPVERIGRRKGDLVFPLDLVMSPVQTGEVRLLTVIVRDLTAQREAEAQLAVTHSQLLEVSRKAGMAEIATAVLHNIGNLLNSVNVSANLLHDTFRGGRVAEGLSKVVKLLQQPAAPALQSDERGRHVVAYLGKLAETAQQERYQLKGEIDTILRGIESMNHIVAMQQARTRVAGVAEEIVLADLLDQALRSEAAALHGMSVAVERRYGPLPTMAVEKHKLLEIVMNLLHNAREALLPADWPRRLSVLSAARGSDRVCISITDNGVGIEEANLTRIFNYGFTTKEGGHGFGLHSGALSAMELGGSLTCESAGRGRGATFMLEIPLRRDAPLGGRQ